MIFAMDPNFHATGNYKSIIKYNVCCLFIKTALLICFCVCAHAPLYNVPICPFFLFIGVSVYKFEGK